MGINVCCKLGGWFQNRMWVLLRHHRRVFRLMWFWCGLVQVAVGGKLPRQSQMAQSLRKFTAGQIRLRVGVSDAFRRAHGLR